MHVVELTAAMTANPFVILYVEDDEFSREAFAEQKDVIATVEDDGILGLS